VNVKKNRQNTDIAIFFA